MSGKSIMRLNAADDNRDSILLAPLSRRYARNRGGFGLVETVVATALVGVLMVAALRTVGVSIFTQYKAAERTAGQMLADGLMAEILAKSYADPDSSPQFGPEAGESSTSKANYDDVDDYQGWNESPPQYADGNPMPDLTGWKRSVAVCWVDPSDVSKDKSSDTGAKRITVTVQHNNVTVASRIAIRTAAP